MRILRALDNSLPLVCGYGIRSGRIVRLQKRDGHEVTVLTSARHPMGDAMREAIDGIERGASPSSGLGRVIAAPSDSNLGALRVSRFFTACRRT